MSVEQEIAARWLVQAGVLLDFPAPDAPVKTTGKVFRFKNKTYALSTDGGPLGDLAEEPEEDPRIIRGPIRNPWKFLWVYDTDRDFVVMWRVTDGNEKEGGSASHYSSQIVRLERKGQINRVTHQEYLVLAAEMRKRERALNRHLEKSIDLSKTDYQRKVDSIAWEVFHKEIEPDVRKRIQDLLRGAHPFGFELNDNILPYVSEKEQMLSYSMSQAFAPFTAELITEELRKWGIDPYAPGVDWQAAHWAWGDVNQQAYEKIKKETLRKLKRTAAEAHTFTWVVGEPVLYGKFKNKHGILKSFGHDAKGNPIVTIEPVPKGRKQDKVMGLFKLRHDTSAMVVASLYREKQAGIFQAPPVLVETFLKWANRVYAEHVLATVTTQVEALRGRVQMIKRAIAEMQAAQQSFERDLDALQEREALRVPLYRFRNGVLVTSYIGVRREVGKLLKGESFYTWGEGEQRVSFTDSWKRRGDVLKAATYKFEHAIRMLKIDQETFETEGDIDEADSVNLVEAIRLQKRTQLYTSKAKLHKAKVSTVIPVTVEMLKGWRYWNRLIEEFKTEAALAKEIQDLDWHLNVSLMFAGHAGRGGVWFPDSLELEVDVLRNGKAGNVLEFEAGLERIADTAQHEFQHVAQYFFKELLGLNEIAGIPSVKIRDPNYDTSGQRKDMSQTGPFKHLLDAPHALQDVEFYTDLQDEVDSFVASARSNRKADLRELFKQWVGMAKSITTQQFFSTLKREAPGKWRKAVAEFYKAITEQGIDIPA